ncbi:MAG: hypothetical protein JWN44_1883 [Myxococcales bacterium]|nr:hypothetical protein [Myxococcales bacterium]
MSGLLARIRELWRNHVAGPKLRTYDAACEELGGAPWRQLPERTDLWFLADQRTDRVPTLDSFVIKKPMSGGGKALLVGSAALTVVALAVVGLVTPAHLPSLASLPSAVVAPAAPPLAIAPPPSSPPIAAPSASPPRAPVVTARATVAPLPTRPHVATKRRVVVARHRRR